MACASLVAPCCLRTFSHNPKELGRKRGKQPEWDLDELAASSASAWECFAAIWLMCCPSNAACDTRRRVRARPEHLLGVAMSELGGSSEPQTKGSGRRTSMMVQELGVSSGALLEYVNGLRHEVKEDILREIPRRMRPVGMRPEGEGSSDDGSDDEGAEDRFGGDGPDDDLDLSEGSGSGSDDTGRGLNVAQASILLAELSELFED